MNKESKFPLSLSQKKKKELICYSLKSRKEIKTPDRQFLSNLTQIIIHVLYELFLTFSPSQQAVRSHGLRSRHLRLITLITERVLLSPPAPLVSPAIST